MSATLQSRPSLYSTAVGKKYVMAISGMVLMGYVLAHMVGNLKIYFGAESLDALQPLAARGRRAGAAARVAAVGRADRAARRAVRAPVGRVHADDDQPPRAADRVPLQARLRGRGLRQPHDALDRDHRPAVRDLPPARPDVGAGEPGLRQRRPVPQHHRVASSASRSRSSTCSRTWRSACTSTTARGACSRAWAGCGRGGASSRSCSPRDRRSATSPSRWPSCSEWSIESSDARVADPAGLDPARVGQPSLHGAAGQRVQQAALQGDRRRHRPGGRARPPPRWPSSATRSRSSRSTTRRGGRTRSPPRAGSTPPRTTATTATRSSGSSTTRSRAGTSARREANVYRLAQVSNEIIDQATAQGVPFAREYGGLLDNRSFGGAQVSRTFYARGQTGQQLLLGAYQAMMRQVAAGQGHSCTRARRCSTSSCTRATRAGSSCATC